jgi:hypothetical protein
MDGRIIAIHPGKAFVSSRIRIEHFFLPIGRFLLLCPARRAKSAARAGFSSVWAAEVSKARMRIWVDV